MKFQTYTSKGQVATEFFLYSGVFLTVLLAAYFTVFFIQSTEVSNKESLYVKWFGESFASHANTAMNGQAGFNYTMKFAKNILGKPYKVQFKPAAQGRNGFVFITWAGNNASFTYTIGNMKIVNGDPGQRCIKTYSPPEGVYYEINPEKGLLNFYNDGDKVILSQYGGCAP